ncbi:MAG: UDP-N-acetylglucosamine 2-epimerase (hydrolyzing) [Actinobacteria bacterium]|nr:UDP-N-acetylglucosamine 2-epimerase (hydrolyzing) [Actinomycetota bacterium]MBU2686334.1 UDP-N-acetylglucosamine 2-epimerase (hydrolyzing) [Actinomycetota bacterium]
MPRRKVLYISGTRADFGLMSSALRRINDHPRLELRIAVTGMHTMPEFGSTIGEIEASGFEFHTIDASYERDDRESMVLFLGRFIGLLADRLRAVKPDIILLLGDRAEMLGGAIVGAYLGLPVAHLHGGDVSSTVDDASRHAITKLASLHLPATRLSARRIGRMGEEPWRIHLVGAPGLDRIFEGDLPSPGEVRDRFSLDPDGPSLLVIQHPVTLEVQRAGAQMRETLEAVVAVGVQALVIYPNADAGGREMIEVIKEYERRGSVTALRTVPYPFYLGLMSVAGAMVGNSSSAVIEAPSFHLPAVNVGTRQAGRETAGNLIDVGYDRGRIAGAIRTALFDREFRRKVRRRRSPYGDGRAGERTAEILAGVEIDERLLDKRQV